MKYWRYEQIEDRVAKRLLEYQQNTGEKLEVPPVPIEKIVENDPFDLSISWETIEEKLGEDIFAGLRPKTKQIVMNEVKLKLFKEKPGLERFSMGHELGHWDLFTEKAGFNHDALPGLGTHTAFVCRESTKGLVEILKDQGFSKRDIQGFMSEYMKKQDVPHERRAVNYYAGALLMPEDLVLKELENLQHPNWDALYYFAEKRFKVTISALCVRLQILGLIYVQDGKIYRSKEESVGQQAFNFG